MKEFIEKLIGRLEEEKVDIGEKTGFSKGINKSIEIVNQLAEEYNQENDDTDYANIELYAFWQKHQWIPCSERLPEYTDEYNVTVDVASEFGCYKTVTTLRFEKIEGREPKWVIPKDKVYRVIAWQPLPPKYEPKGE